MEARSTPRWPTGRQHTRVRLFAPVESQASGATSLGRADNVSLGGLLVLARETFQPGTEVIVRFNLPSGYSIEAQGVVVHALPGARMGIQFSELKPADLKAIEEFIQKG